ncbi:MAG: HD domain-containing protein [Spirochaetales bacterium]|nr:MAG: HD domain-containing protein [Spirochaetales bacterium]
MLINCAGELRDYVREHMSEKRFEHCLRTEETAVRLCGRYGVSAEDSGSEAGDLCCCSTAAISHDIARELPEDLMLDYASRYMPLTDWEKKYPLLSHGKAGAYLLSTRFGITSREICEAVRTHTVAEPGMGTCAKIVYIADYTEPGRSHLEPDFWDRYGDWSLNRLLLTVLEKTIT